MLRTKIIKFAFTLAETILTMTILGIIAAVMITTLKPAQYRDQAFNTLKKKTYKDLYTATDTLMMECCKDANATEIHNDCDLTKPTHPFGDDSGLKEATLYARYLKGTVALSSGTAVDNCAAISNYTAMKLKNGACIYFGLNSIQVDVNGSEGPNDDGDRMDLTIDSDGIATAMDDAIKTTFSGGESGSEQGGEQGENQSQNENLPLNDCSQYTSCPQCTANGCICPADKVFHNGGCKYCSSVVTNFCAECTESACTKCSSGYRLSNGSCVKCADENCAECTESACTKCKFRYGLLSDGSCIHCVDIDAKCTECNDSGCTKCYSYHGLASDGTCKYCSSFGFYNCADCTPSSCTNCNSGYSLHNGSCIKCPDNCAECNESGICTRCYDRYRQTDEGCVSCPYGCDECNESGCTKCWSSRSLIDGTCVF